MTFQLDLNMSKMFLCIPSMSSEKITKFSDKLQRLNAPLLVDKFLSLVRLNENSLGHT